MDLNTLIAECTAYDFKVMLEEKKPKSWLKSVSAFANGLGGSLFFGIDNNGQEISFVVWIGNWSKEPYECWSLVCR